MRARLASTVFLLLLSGCAGDAERYDRSLVSREIEARTGHDLGAAPQPGAAALPGDVRPEDGIAEEEAVAIALWNNAPFQEALSELGFARADLIQAGLLANPTFSLLFPIGPKQLEFTAFLPLDAFLLRPRRVAIAEQDAERLAALLVENGLDLVESVREAYADLGLARERKTIAAEDVELREEIAAFQQSRFAGGDVSELTADLSRLEAMESRQDVERYDRDVAIAEARLRDLLGLGEEWREATFVVPPGVPARGASPGAAESAFEDDPERLAALAFAARPDLRAAELGMKAAGERAGLARWEVLTAAAGIDLNEDANRAGEEGPEIGPALRMELPLFDWNQAGRARAHAGLERAARRYVSVRRRIALAVEETHLRFRQVASELRSWRREIVPALEAALRGAERAHEIGATSRLPVLETRERLLAARAREAELTAELQRARARLERSIGGRLPDAAAVAALPRARPPANPSQGH